MRKSLCGETAMIKKASRRWETGSKWIPLIHTIEGILKDKSDILMAQTCLCCFYNITRYQSILNGHFNINCKLICMRNSFLKDVKKLIILELPQIMCSPFVAMIWIGDMSLSKLMCTYLRQPVIKFSVLKKEQCLQQWH